MGTISWLGGNYMRKDILKQLLENDIEKCEEYLAARLGPDQMILDGFVVDGNTFEDIRELTEDERKCFYTIRINEMRLRMIEEE
jgi:hypothetical protein